MLQRNVENDSNTQGDAEVELSRRSFFGRLAMGAMLSMALPRVVNAASKSSAVKADKTRLAQAERGAVRLPKHAALQASKAGAHAPAKSELHAVVAHAEQHGRSGHAAAAKPIASSPMAQAKQTHLSAKQAAISRHAHDGKAVLAAHETKSSELRHTRVRDVYTGKKQVLHQAQLNHGRVQISRGGSIAQPSVRESLIEPVTENFFLADRGRFASHRSLAFQNPHTGDSLNLTYFEKGRYISDALDEISFLLRDYRTGDVYPIDPELLDQLHDLKQMLGLNQAFDVVCGYRSPLTNARLHAENSGVANNSFHMHGRAVDIRVERFDLRRIRNAALAMHRGGVGYYPESNFIHLDTGTFRTWSL
jgi:uncharacterized protein YcbK (DUF882 family)